MIPEGLFQEIVAAVTSRFDSRRWELDIFLCGPASGDHKSLRKQLGDALQREIEGPRYRLDTHFAEDLFLDLLREDHHQNLLDLESHLAQWVDLIVIILEGAGAIAELGAFSNNENLRKKLLVIVDKKHKKENSFIRRGPLRLLEKDNKGSVCFVDLKELGDEMIDELAQKIRKSAIRNREEKKISSLATENLFALEMRCLGLIYILSPISRQFFVQSLETVWGKEKNKKVGQIMVGFLQRKKYIQSDGEEILLTGDGRQRIFDRLRLSRKTITALDVLRVRHFRHKWSRNF